MTLAMALAFGSPAAGAEIILVQGAAGSFQITDNLETPGAKCGYSAADGSGTAYLRWIKVFPFYPGPGTGVDSQPVRFSVTVQRSKDNGVTWKNVATSPPQTKIASTESNAMHTPIKVYVTGAPGQLFRAIGNLKWVVGGSVVGTVKLRMEYYGVKWTVGDPRIVYFNACDGASD